MPDGIAGPADGWGVDLPTAREGHDPRGAATLPGPQHPVLRRMEALACAELRALHAASPDPTGTDGPLAAYIDWDLDAPAS